MHWIKLFRDTYFLKGIRFLTRNFGETMHILPKFKLFFCQNLAYKCGNIKIPQARFSALYISWKYRSVLFRKYKNYKIWLVVFWENYYYLFFSSKKQQIIVQVTSTCMIFSEFGVILIFNTQSVPIDAEIEVNVVFNCQIYTGLVH